jgi:predicted enzyme related to lactoylglutathione lyase
MSNSANHHRIDYIELGTSDLAASKAFFQQVFGWEFTDYGPDYTSFKDGRLDGGFSAIRPGMAGGALLVLYSSDLEGTQKKVQAAGGKIILEIFSFPGGRRFHFGEPGGNELAVWSE